LVYLVYTGSYGRVTAFARSWWQAQQKCVQKKPANSKAINATDLIWEFYNQ